MLSIGRKPYSVEEVKAHAKLDDYFGDMWVHQRVFSPAPNFPPEIDRRHPGYMLVAKFEYDSRMVKLGMEEAGIVSNDPVLTISRAQLRHHIKRGDRFTRIATNEAYEVTDSKPDGASGIIVNIVQMGRKAE